MLEEENVSGGEKLGLHGKKKMRSGALEKKNQRAFACTANVHSRVL